MFIRAEANGQYCEHVGIPTSDPELAIELSRAFGSKFELRVDQWNGAGLCSTREPARG